LKFNVGGSLEKRFEDGPNRLLKLCLTDGPQRVMAIEFQSIPQLSVLHTVPGTKILVSNVLVRRGTLLLVPSGVLILGGGVEELIKKFDQVRKQSVKSLLPQEWMDELGAVEANDVNEELQREEERDENNEDNQMVEAYAVPRIDKSRLVNVDRVQENQNSRLNNNNNNNNSITIVRKLINFDAPQQQQPINQHPITPVQIINKNLITPPKPIITKRKPRMSDENNDIDYLIDLQESPNSNNNNNNNNNYIQKSPLKKLPHDNENDVSPLASYEILKDDITVSFPAKKQKLNTLESKNSYHSPDQSLFGIESMFSEENFSLFDEPIVARPFQYLCEKENDVIVKGYLQSVVKGTFKVINNKFTMQANIEDGTDKLLVAFDNQVLISLVGLTPEEYHQHQIDVSKNSILKAKLYQFQNKLKTLQGMFHIINCDNSPLLIDISSPTSQVGNSLVASMK